MYPLSPTTGQLFFDPISGKVFVFTESSWKQIGSLVSSNTDLLGFNDLASKVQEHLTPQTTLKDISNPIPLSFEQIKEQTQFALMMEISRARLKYATSLPCQDDIYREKITEAIEIKARISTNQPIDITQYPFIRAEVTVTGLSIEQACDTIIKARTIWVNKMAEIEIIRHSATKALQAANNQKDLDALLEVTKSVLKNILGVVEN